MSSRVFICCIAPAIFGVVAFLWALWHLIKPPLMRAGAGDELTIFTPPGYEGLEPEENDINNTGG